jgi:ABC-type glycerol-3-phosphate transport system substrate-binding protein
MWIAGSWNFTGLREAKVDFVVSPVPRIFKQPTVWTMPHQFTFPKAKSVDAAKRDGAWAYMRWMSDHVAEWTLKAGQVSALRKPHSTRASRRPVLRPSSPGAPGRAASPRQRVAAENLRAVIGMSIRPKPARSA